MMSARCVQPEILDTLPSDAEAARRSRRDLRVINRLMGSRRWFRRVLQERARADDPVLEIGAGEGELGRTLMAMGMGPVQGLDLLGRPKAWPAAAQWWRMSVFDFDGWAQCPVVIGSLVFHHFRDEELARLGERMQRGARLIVASEPARTPATLRWFSLLCPLIGADAVTRHDGKVSIEAGFRGAELPRLLGLSEAAWRWTIEQTALGTYRMVAERRP